MKRAGLPVANTHHFLDQALAYLRTGDKSWSCHAGTLYLLILPDGNVAPCNELPPVFNILKEDPVALLKNRKYREKVTKMRKACGGCLHDCWREPSNLLKPSIMLERGIEYLKGHV